jgi:hypothetical protein
MDNESYEETRLPRDDWAKYLKEGTTCTLVFFNGKVGHSQGGGAGAAGAGGALRGGAGCREGGTACTLVFFNGKVGHSQGGGKRWGCRGPAAR